MDVRMFTVGMVQENAYLVRRDGSDRALMIDPGDEAPMLLSAIEQLGLTLDGHFRREMLHQPNVCWHTHDAQELVSRFVLKVVDRSYRRHSRLR